MSIKKNIKNVRTVYYNKLNTKDKETRERAKQRRKRENIFCDRVNKSFGEIQTYKSLPITEISSSVSVFQKKKNTIEMG